MVSNEITVCDLTPVAVILPALNEAANLAILLPRLANLGVGQIVVCDNGSTDETPAVVEACDTERVYVPQRGYGEACFAGMQHLSPTTQIVVFLDADLSDDVAMLPALVEPIANGECDFVVSSRVASLRQRGAMTLAQRLANWMVPLMIRCGWGHRYTDLGPFRAIRRSSLDAIGMRDRAFGWTIEMQVRAVELGLRIREIPVPYGLRRAGTSKISGSLLGASRAAYWILRTGIALYLTKRGRR